MRIPLPTYDEVPLPVLVEKVYDFVTWYLDVKPWKCKKCGLTNFGRNKKCADVACGEIRDERNSS